MSPNAKPGTLLTGREIEILTHMSMGLETKQIAAAMHRSPDTIKTSKRRIYSKLRAKNGYHALALYLRGAGT